MNKKTAIILSLAQIIFVACNNIISGTSAEFSSKLASESFMQKAEPSLDVLFIVDNSPGMQEEQAAIGDNFQDFLSSLGKINWQVGITTTDVSAHLLYGLQGRLLSFSNLETPQERILTPKTPDFEGAFYHTIVRPETIKPAEGYTPASFLVKPFEAFLGALEKRNSENLGFFRNESDLAVIMITNSDNSMVGNQVYPPDVLDEFHRTLGNTKKIRVYGIVIQVGDSVCFNTQRAQSAGDETYGKYISELTSMTGGIVSNICSSDYSELIQKVGNDARNFVQSFLLEHPPAFDSAVVVFKPTTNAVPWKIEGRQLIFLEDLPPSTEVTVEYKY